MRRGESYHHGGQMLGLLTKVALSPITGTVAAVTDPMGEDDPAGKIPPIA